MKTLRFIVEGKHSKTEHFENDEVIIIMISLNCGWGFS